MTDQFNANPPWSLEKRISMIVDYAYRLFCNQVEGGIIHIDNEASMQLHLSNILLQLGRLNVFAPDEQFKVSLEKKIELNEPTCKSKKIARIDIWVEIVNSNGSHAAAIELKFLKSENPAVTDARHSVYKDLENLEHYAALTPGLDVCEIICTDNPNFMVNKGEKFSISDNTVVSSYAGDNTYAPIELHQTYAPLKWDRLGKYNFLKI